MASNSPESPSKKRKQTSGTKHGRRGQPLFASRRAAPTLQQPPDFLTDSLNTSYIPSPSPSRSPTRESLRAKPRQAQDRTSLAATFKSLSDINDENQPPSSTTSAETKSIEQTGKPRPSQINRRTPSKSSDKPAQSPVRVRTPTPPRGRQKPITSPSNSESSPGRGYAEAYQRIVEEENLAQEDSVDDLELDANDFSNEEISQQLDLRQLQRKEKSASPMSIKTSGRASPRGNAKEELRQDAMEDKENRANDADIEADVYSMEDITDASIGSGSSQHARDVQRLKGVMKSGGVAFSKARLGERVGLTVDNLRRRNGSSESLGSAFSAESISNRGSDPSVNVPKAWGRKAKPGKDWLSRINSRSGRSTADTSKSCSSGVRVFAEDGVRREKTESADDWMAAAVEIPLPQNGSSPSQTTLSSRGSTPATTVQRSTPLDRRREWEVNDDEFTGRSLQISESPPIRIRNGTLDRIREQEIENFDQVTATSNRLGELRDRTSEEQRRGKSFKTASPETTQNIEEGVQESNQQRHSSDISSERLRFRKSYLNTPDATLEEAGEPVPDTPVVIYKNDSEFSANAGKISSQRGATSSGRPTRDRKDSHDLLKRLARAASESPSPTKEQMEACRQSQGPQARIDMDRTPLPSKSSRNLNTPVVTGAWVDQTFGQTPQISKPDTVPNTTLKTPFVTGGWIDTPIPKGGRGPPAPAPSKLKEDNTSNTSKLGALDLIRRLSPNTKSDSARPRDQQPLIYTGPPLSKSALEEIIREAKAPHSGSKSDYIHTTNQDPNSEEDPTLHLGDSTIQSLEELIANDTDFSTLLAPLNVPSSSEASPVTSEPSPSSTAPSQPSTDPQSYSNLLARLANLAPSLRASKHQLSSLERAVSTTPATTTNRVLTQRANQCNEAGELHDFIWPCQTCGCPGRLDPDLDSLFSLRDNITSIRIPIPRLWRWRRHDWRPRLTWLGTLTVLAWALLWAELYARFKYTHPRYATTMVGYGVDIHAPQPPFVLFKVLYRKCALASFLSPLYLLARATCRLAAAFVGYIFGFMFGDAEGGGGGSGGGAGGGKRPRDPVSRDPRIPRPDWGPDLSLFDDQFL